MLPKPRLAAPARQLHGGPVQGARGLCPLLSAKADRTACSCSSPPTSGKREWEPDLSLRRQLGPASGRLCGQAVPRSSAECPTAAGRAHPAGTSLILGARLASDLAGRRVGRPDLLVAAPTGGYWPGDIKWHRSLEPARDSSSALPGLCCPLGGATPDRAGRGDPTICGQFLSRPPEN